MGGLNQSLSVRKIQRYDKKLEKEMRNWIAEQLPKMSDQILNEEKDLKQILQSGVILCHLINSIQPDTVTNISILKTPFKQMENISLYIKGCTKLGLPQTALFTTLDLYEGNDMSTVLANVQYLRNLQQKPSEAEVTVKRERISQVLKTKPKEIEDAASASIDISWRKDLEDKPSSPVTKPSPKPKPNPVPTGPLPKWKQDLIEREERRRRQKALEETSKYIARLII